MFLCVVVFFGLGLISCIGRKKEREREPGGYPDMEYARKKWLVESEKRRKEQLEQERLHKERVDMWKKRWKWLKKLFRR